MRALATLAAQQLVDRHVGLLALDVPQRLVDAGDGVVEHRPVAPVAVHHHHAKEFLDARDIAADEEGLEVMLDGRLHGEDALCEGGAAQAVETRFGRDDLDDAQARPARLGENDLNVFDGYS